MQREISIIVVLSAFANAGDSEWQVIQQSTTTAVVSERIAETFAARIRIALRDPKLFADQAGNLLRFAPQTLSTVIALGIVLQVTWVAKQWIADAKAQRVTSVPALQPTLSVPTSHGVDVQKIVGAHLFGNLQLDTGVDGVLPQSKVPLVAVGTIAFDDRHDGFAFIGQTATTTKLFRVGEEVSPSVKLNAVYADRVVLDRSGTLESLSLPKKFLKGTAAPPALIANAAPATSADAPLPNDPQFLGDMLSVRPVTLDGSKFPTYKIFPAAGAKNSMATFRRVGLRPGDLVTAIDGTPLLELSASKSVLADLGKATSATIDVKRGDQRVQLVVGL